jgi:hypothetical protein
MKISKATSADIKEMTKSMLVPIIIIDEFAVRLKGSPSNDSLMQTRFMRNVLRSLDFILITAGTNYRAANLIGAEKVSGESILMFHGVI